MILDLVRPIGPVEIPYFGCGKEGMLADGLTFGTALLFGFRLRRRRSGYPER